MDPSGDRCGARCRGLDVVTSLTHRQRAALARNRDLVTTLQENEAIAEQLRRSNEVSHKKTPNGPVKRPPKVADADQALDELHGEIGSAVKAAKKASDRERVIEGSSSVDERRFPAVCGGAR